MNKAILAALSLMLVGLVAASATAWGGMWQNEEARAAVEADDYDAFLDAVRAENENRMAHMTEEKFQHMVENNQRHRDVLEALENEDFSAWKQAVESMPKSTDYITEDNFSRYVEMHKMMMEGDADAAREIADELGIPMGPGNGRAMGKAHSRGGMQNPGLNRQAGFAGRGSCGADSEA